MCHETVKELALRTKIKHLFQLIILSVALFGCAKQEEQIIPYVRVNLSVNLQLPQFNALNSVNNAILYPDVGYNRNGVIIYRNSTDEFTAYDATCPKHIETKTAVVLDDGGSAGTATCPNCSTVYSFFSYGYPSNGHPLKSYTVTKSGNTLYINN